MSTEHMKVFQDSMARFTSSISAITTAEHGVPGGVLATSVCSLSADPPTILVCINKSASVHDVIVRSKAFAVNLLSDRQVDVAARFNKEKGAARFDTARWTTGATGSPVLIDSLVTLDCRLIATHHGYSHTILIGEIAQSFLHDNPDANALLWHKRNFSSPVPCAA
ncbi:flavin reductase family protein [Burkholderia sp. 3C]